MYFGGNLNHGIGSVGDLPIPFDTVLNISGLVIVLTFVFLKVSWKESLFIKKEIFVSQTAINWKGFWMVPSIAAYSSRFNW